jgi:hypothetical protein
LDPPSGLPRIAAFSTLPFCCVPTARQRAVVGQAIPAGTKHGVVVVDHD